MRPVVVVSPISAFFTVAILVDPELSLSVIDPVISIITETSRLGPPAAMMPLGFSDDLFSTGIDPVFVFANRWVNTPMNGVFMPTSPTAWTVADVAVGVSTKLTVSWSTSALVAGDPRPLCLTA